MSVGSFRNLWCGTVRDRYRHHGPGALAGADGQAPAAHHFKSLTNVFKCNSRFCCTGRVKTPAAVFYNDLTAGIRLFRQD